MSEKMVGIVAGVGPFAGLDLLGKMLQQTTAAKDQDHLSIVSISAPNEILDRTDYLLGQVAVNPGYALASQLVRLSYMGAAVAGIPCNTAHAPPIWDLLQTELAQAGCAIHLLHMIQETGRFLQEAHPLTGCVGVLSTTGTYLTEIYPAVLEPLGLRVVVPQRPFQEKMVHTAVYDPVYGLKACGLITPAARQNLLQGIELLRAAGAEAIILGCTEMPLAIPERRLDSLPIIDPTLILARALIREASPAKLKPLDQ